jgi:copper chaperone CopZ
MKHTYQITGMTCSSCESKVKNNLLILPEVTAVEVSKETNTAIVSMDEHVALSKFQEALGGKHSKYEISDQAHSEIAEETKSFLKTYLPVLLLLGYVSLVSFIASWQNGTINGYLFMRFFMAGFFMAFSFFKLINLQAFAESYAMYDVVAKRFKSWGYFLRIY